MTAGTQSKIIPLVEEPAAAGDFTLKEGEEFAGTHLLIDLWGAERLDDQAYMQQTLKDCVTVSFATLLHIHCHQFSQTGGLSAVALLAESHISVHTWPEREYAAFDVFMCGATEPQNVIEVLKNAFNPQDTQVTEILRGRKVTS